MATDEPMFLSRRPDALPLYEELRDKPLTECPDITLKVQKSLITFKAQYSFAFVSLRRMKSCPEVFFILSFGLSHRMDSPRIAMAAELYPGRRTHHVAVSEAEQPDTELMGWLQETRDFALVK